MMSSKKKVIKVSLDGEVKRLKMPTSYDNLVRLTYEKFPNQGLEKVVPLKFYYLDDEQELISITSQSDFVEALEIDDVSNLKLIVANSATEARSLLEKQLGDTMSLQGSMHNVQQPVFGSTFTPRMSNVGMGRIDTMSDLLQEPIEERRCETERAMTPANFLDNMIIVFEKTITEVKSLVNPSSTTDQTKFVPEPLKMPEVIEKLVEQPKPEMINTTSAKQPACEGLDDEVVAKVREEIKKLCAGGLKDLIVDHRKKNEQTKVVHEGYLCDVCEKVIVGIRYKCTQREDYDLCEKCEPNDKDHTFLKIRRPNQAPAKLIVKYNNQTAPFMQQMPDLHIDQTVNMNDLANTFKTFCGAFGMPQQMQAPAQPTSDLKMPTEVPSMPKPVETPIVTKTEQPVPADDEDYQLEDVSIVEDLTQSQNPFEDATVTNTKPTEQQPILEELKNWTPKPEIEQSLSKEELYKIEAAAEGGYLRVGLLQLLELGFCDFQRNKQLMERFNLNVQAVASAIIEDDELYA